MAADPRPGILQSLAQGVLPLLVRLMGITWSFRVVNGAVLRDYIRAGKPLIAVVWHQIAIPATWFFRDIQAVLMVSRSRDGELAARFGERLGFRAVRGSSTRGGGEALRELVERVRAGAQSAITVDGPRGPARDPKAGCVLAARDTGAPIIPIACRASRALHAKNWDRTLIPLPFSRLVVSLGDPIYVPAGASDEECERYRARVRDSLLAAESAAQRAL